MKMKRYYIIFIIFIVTLFSGFVILFDTFPRSEFSELEKRDLATFPKFTWDSFFSGDFTKEVSTWFSDSEPYRDRFMSLSMEVDNAMRLLTGEDDIKIQVTQQAEPALNVNDATTSQNQEDLYDENMINSDDNAKLANSGIIIVGSGENVRALMIYGGGANGGQAYADAANKYKETFGAKVNVYSMTIPNSTEFYCPEKVKKYAKPQRPTIDNIHSLLSPSVKAVDVYKPLSQHVKEDIYLRTDHHWAPLGAFYAAQEFARVAGVPFRNLDSYERRVVKNFVGSMYGYSKDISVKKAPEDFVYYVPKGVTYSTTYIVYDVNQNYQVTRESRPMTGPFFYKFKDGSGGAYSTFMGSDKKITQVKTSTKNGRKVMIIKDSYGNAIPGYLFYSFEEVHVVDARYFTKNMKRYVEAYGITDILFAFNIFNAYSSSFPKKTVRYLTQPDGTIYPADKVEKTPADSVVKELPKVDEQPTVQQEQPTEQSATTDVPPVAESSTSVKESEPVESSVSADEVPTE